MLILIIIIGCVIIIKLLAQFIYIYKIKIAIKYNNKIILIIKL